MVFREFSVEGFWDFNFLFGGIIDDMCWKVVMIDYFEKEEFVWNNNQLLKLKVVCFVKFFIECYQFELN